MQQAEMVPTHDKAGGAQKPGMQNIEDHESWPLLSRLPMRVTAAIPLRRFKVKDLIELKAGQTISSDWTTTDDVPFKIGAIQLSWCEFEVVEQHMAARLTRLT